MGRIEVIKAAHEGYRTMYAADSWRVGLITPAERFEKITYLERHNKTDEIFILLSGRAVLIGMDEEGCHTMELVCGNLYRVPRSCWHNIRIFEHTVVAVVEAADTSKDNTDYIDYTVEP